MLNLLTGLDQVEKLGDFNEEAFLNGNGQGLLQGLGPTEKEGDVYTTQGNGLFLFDNPDDRFPKSNVLSQLRNIHEDLIVFLEPGAAISVGSQSNAEP